MTATATATATRATARPVATPRPIVGSDLYRHWKERSKDYHYCGGKGQVMKLHFKGDVYEVFRALGSDCSDTSSPIFKNGKYFLSWHVATMILSDGWYNLSPLGECWTAQFTNKQVGLLLCSLKELEGKTPWGVFIRQMNNFRYLDEEGNTPFSKRLASIHLPQEGWIGVY